MDRLSNILFFGALLFLAGCTSLIESDPSVTFESNVLRPKISFKTTDSIAVYIQYWKSGPQGKQKSIVSTGFKHDIYLLNLTGETDYSYTIHTFDGKNKSNRFQFKTEKVPEDIFDVKKEKIDPTVFQGYILIRNFGLVGADIIVNNEGDVVWYHNYNREVRRQFSWTDRNTVLSGVDTAHVVEIDLFGNEVIDIDLDKAEHPLFMHHEILYDKEGAIVTLFTDSTLVNTNTKIGKRYAYTDGIVKLSGDGELLWKWNVAGDLNLAEGLKRVKTAKGRISHSNSLTIDEDGNYLISFRDFEQIWKIDAKSGEVKWKLGKGGDIEMDTIAYFIGQHSLYVENGRLIVFDNGHPRFRPYSRILAFRIDEVNKKAKAELIVDIPKELTSYRMGSAYQIGNDKFLVCTSTRPMTLSVINTNGEILWKIGGSQSSYRAYFIENPFTVN